MKILHILDHSIPLHSGYTFRTRSILTEQRRRGWETSHVTGTRHEFRNSMSEDVEQFRFYRTRPPGDLLARLPVVKEWRSIQALARRIVEVAAIEKPDVLHAHSPALNGVAAVLAARKLRLPVVYEIRAFWEDAAVDHGTTTEGSMRYKATRAMETWVMRRVNAITTICEGLRAEIVTRGIPSVKVTVIPNAVDADRFEFQRPPKTELAEKLGLAGRPVIGFIGSFYGYEGLLLLVKGLARVQLSLPDLRLLLVGGGVQEKNVRRQVAECGLEDKVVFTGRVPHEQVADYYDLVDAFVYPRIKMRLTDLVTPLKPLEAMAQGKLVIASDVGGHKELIRNGETGYLFPAGDADALALTLIRAFKEKDKWAAIHAAGRRFVESERTWANSVARYEQVYAKAGVRRSV